MTDEEYSAKNITVLGGIEAVRKRPGMYIGSTDIRGLHHLVYEIVDNSIDEAMMGHCSEIIVIIHKDGSVSVSDDGRGIPVDNHPKYNKPVLEIIMTKLHAGGKFDKDSYKVSGGLHGVGISVVNALSKWVEIEVKKNGKEYVQKYERGFPVTELETVGPTDEKGTNVRFFPDDEIFDTITFQFEILSSRLRELAFLNKGINISLKDERTDKEKNFMYEGGIISFIEHLNAKKHPLHEPIFFEKEKNGTIVEIAMQYTDAYNEMLFSFVNNINTIEGGSHVSGFKTALTRSINNYSEKNNLNKDSKLSSDDVREGLTVVISLKVPEPQFEGQTKTKLGNSDVKGIVDSVVSEKLGMFFEENPSVAKEIITKCVGASKAREAARKARELVRRKSILEGSTLPGKLADCSDKNPENCEIYIVEGDSAGGSAKQGRDRGFQAILPLRGKIINVEKARMHKVLQNNEIIAMITALGTSIDDEFDISKLRYHKVIIMTDSDVDGAHIGTLLLTFFYRHLKELVEKGHIYLAQPPLYLLKKGKKEIYAQNEDIRTKITEEWGKDGLHVQRYKGLGEMNPIQLWDTTMDPATRFLKRVTIEDAVEADETFVTLMGSEVPPRKKFIQDHAKEVINLDI
ncbi:DNA topoisomerase (ATP-hydrolyzing) subunit B [archaeon]|jgi:DNA gyrase subunit B|nr:DNA topoisomerase (ATP-hydrolyzing) subunit B [archaeon]MBT4646787.1 DNA topoisomerase (ATP-hydrolyzing) subunit B [archaeon]MBT6821463.1 DNA topoisomerase (ATP-hydrolyzing) subunit B [archaeon]MBT7392945.1 DNA topoisomerase (ATP-hydrolyzing) subunit B [archaeon]